MKKLLLMLFAFSLLAAGCSREDDKPQDLLLGSWKPVKYVMKHSLNGTPEVTTENVSICSQQSRMNFETNGNGTSTTFSVKNSVCSQTDFTTFTYHYDTNTKKITINEGGTSSTQDVIILTSSTLVLSISDSFTMGDQTHHYVLETYLQK